MKPHTIKPCRRKRNHKIKCLKCELIFLSSNLKTNRICVNCKRSYAWLYKVEDTGMMK